MRSVYVLCNAIDVLSGSRLGVILVASSVVFGTGVALPMDMVFGMPCSSLDMTWTVISISVNGPFVCDDSLLYCVDISCLMRPKQSEGDPHKLSVQSLRSVGCDRSGQSIVCT